MNVEIAAVRYGYVRESTNFADFAISERQIDEHSENEHQLREISVV